MQTSCSRMTVLLKTCRRLSGMRSGSDACGPLGLLLTATVRHLDLHCAGEGLRRCLI